MPPWITVLVAVITVLVAICGWLVARVHTLNQLDATQRETIDSLRRQVDRMEITAELTDKIMSELPRLRSRGGRQ